MQETAFHRRRGCKPEWHMLHILHTSHILHILYIHILHISHILHIYYRKDYSQTRPMKYDQAGFEMTYFWYFGIFVFFGIFFWGMFRFCIFFAIFCHIVHTIKGMIIRKGGVFIRRRGCTYFAYSAYYSTYSAYSRVMCISCIFCILYTMHRMCQAFQNIVKLWPTPTQWAPTRNCMLRTAWENTVQSVCSETP